MLEVHQTASGVQCWLSETASCILNALIPALKGLSTSDPPPLWSSSCKVLFIPPEQSLSWLHWKQADNVLLNAHFFQIDLLVAKRARPCRRCLCSFNWFSISDCHLKKSLLPARHQYLPISLLHWFRMGLLWSIQYKTTCFLDFVTIFGAWFSSQWDVK